MCGDGGNNVDHGGDEEGEDELNRVLKADHDDVALVDFEVGQSDDDLAGNEVHLVIGEGFFDRSDIRHGQSANSERFSKQ